VLAVGGSASAALVDLPHQGDAEARRALPRLTTIGRRRASIGVSTPIAERDCCQRPCVRDEPAQQRLTEERRHQRREGLAPTTASNVRRRERPRCPECARSDREHACAEADRREFRKMSPGEWSGSESSTVASAPALPRSDLVPCAGASCVRVPETMAVIFPLSAAGV
jgi:hypothetical protein